MLRRQVKPGLVNINSYDCGTNRGSELRAESADSPHTHKYSHVIRS
jgi:hypothetical protein